MFRTPVEMEEVQAAALRIRPFVHATPVLTSTSLDAIAGRQLFFKAENLQKTGSFKARGACNAVLLEKERNPESVGVVTHSSGNHAQALAYAAKCVKLPCTVVVPRGTPKVKCEAIRRLGADLVFCHPTPHSRVDTCASIAEETGKTIIHSSDNYDVMAGQGTIALELLEEVPDLDAIVVATGGGGMLAGVSAVAQNIQPKCQVYAVEPVGKDLQRCLKAKQRLWPEPSTFLHTVADAIRLRAIGHLAFPIICKYASPRVFTVTDHQMIEGMKFAFVHMKQVVEAAAGAGVYAGVKLMGEVAPAAHKVGVILCGGNVDLDNLPWVTPLTTY
ncbi:serine racemase-like [Procambarus clarkii]|uniref:serine racemase-like n=1 Tax=Procambarus clarkii TaxID=6728 RepID=UPI001E673091|nr:probable serine racemase [Procambarus clarkii]